MDLENEYLPPRYLYNAAGWIDQLLYEETLMGLVSCPEFQQIPQLTSWEAAKLVQWEASQQILGSIHTRPNLPSDLVLASSEGSFLKQVPMFTELLNQLLESADSVAVQLSKPQGKAVAFYLDLAGIPHWNALASDGDSYRLYVEPGYMLVADF